MGAKVETIHEFNTEAAWRAFEEEALRRLRALAENVERVGLVGTMTAILKKADGRVLVTRKDNLIVDVGWDFISDAIGATSGRPGIMSHIGVGTDNTAADAAQTDLLASSMRKAATFTKPTTKSFQFETTFDPGEATGALVEAGVFNASSSGIMLDRVVFSVINKAAGDTLTQRFNFTMS